MADDNYEEHRNDKKREPEPQEDRQKQFSHRASNFAGEA
jgi:hypothetical protein